MHLYPPKCFRVIPYVMSISAGLIKLLDSPCRENPVSALRAFSFPTQMENTPGPDVWSPTVSWPPCRSDVRDSCGSPSEDVTSHPFPHKWLHRRPSNYVCCTDSLNSWDAERRPDLTTSVMAVLVRLASRGRSATLGSSPMGHLRRPSRRTDPALAVGTTLLFDICNLRKVVCRDSFF